MKTAVSWDEKSCSLIGVYRSLLTFRRDFLPPSWEQDRNPRVERNITDIGRGRTFQQSVNLYQDTRYHIVDDSISRSHRREHVRLRNSNWARVLPSWYITLVVYIYFYFPMRWIFSNLPNPSDRTMVLGSTQPLTEMSTRILKKETWG
jgi:hypothetical protein